MICMICNRCGKRFASHASVLNHQKQLSSKCWKTYSLLLDLQQQPNGDSETNTNDNEQPSSPALSPSPPTSPSESTSTLPCPPLEVDMDSPPLKPSSTPEVDMEIDDQPLPSFHAEFFQGSSEVYGKGETYLDLFDKDEYAYARQTNLFYPFASRQEWELASFLLKSDLSRVAIDQFLNLQLVSTNLSIELSD